MNWTYFNKTYISSLAAVVTFKLSPDPRGQRVKYDGNLLTAAVFGPEYSSAVLLLLTAVVEIDLNRMNDLLNANGSGRRRGLSAHLKGRLLPPSALIRCGWHIETGTELRVSCEGTRIKLSRTVWLNAM